MLNWLKKPKRTEPSFDDEITLIETAKKKTRKRYKESQEKLNSLIDDLITEGKQ